MATETATATVTATATESAEDRLDALLARVRTTRSTATTLVSNSQRNKQNVNGLVDLSSKLKDQLKHLNETREKRQSSRISTSTSAAAAAATASVRSSKPLAGDEDDEETSRTLITNEEPDHHEEQQLRSFPPSSSTTNSAVYKTSAVSRSSEPSTPIVTPAVDNNKTERQSSSTIVRQGCAIEIPDQARSVPPTPSPRRDEIQEHTDPVVHRSAVVVLASEEEEEERATAPQPKTEQQPQVARKDESKMEIDIQEYESLVKERDELRTSSKRQEESIKHLSGKIAGLETNIQSYKDEDSKGRSKEAVATAFVASAAAESLSRPEDSNNNVVDQSAMALLQVENENLKKKLDTLSKRNQQNEEIIVEMDEKMKEMADAAVRRELDLQAHLEEDSNPWQSIANSFWSSGK